MRSRVMAVLSLVTACGLLVACGSGAGSTSTNSSLSSDQYKQFLSQLSDQENKAQSEVQKGLHSSSVSKLRRTLTTFANDQEDIAKKLSGVTPPADAQSANADLASALSQNAASIKDVVARIAEAQSVHAALAEISQDKAAKQAGKKIDAAIAELKKLGYTKGS